MINTLGYGVLNKSEGGFKMGKKYSRLLEQEYDAMKLLQNAGVSYSKAATALGRSASTIHAVYRSNSYEDYRNAVKIRLNGLHERRKAKSLSQETVETAQNIVEQDARLIDTLALLNSKLDSMLENQKQVESALQAIVDIMHDKEAKANIAFWKR